MTPRVTVFTPSHDAKYLDQCWDSLASQTFQDFEWLVLYNGAALGRHIVANDPRVHTYDDPSTGVGVGHFKRVVLTNAHGEFFVELDHDDLLATTALEEIVAAFHANPEAGLVYSDCAQVNEDLSYNDERFADGHGWTYRNSLVDVGATVHNVMVCESKPPTPHNVSYIWYAPNHVRAYRRSVYEAVGGYNPELSVCDDADLMCRMYQAAPFVHIPLCLYLQRLHSNNTQRDAAKNALIQSETVRIYDENIQPNALIWAGREGLDCFDLGGAHNCPPGYEPLDQALGHGHILDWLRRQKDDTVGVFRAVDFIEHVREQIQFMNEIYRVLAPGGMLLSLTPSTDGRGAWCDPTHVSFWNELSFRYYCDPEYFKYVPGIISRFRQSRLFTFHPTPWHEQNMLPYVCANLTKEPPSGNQHQAGESGQVHSVGE